MLTWKKLVAVATVFLGTALVASSNLALAAKSHPQAAGRVQKSDAPARKTRPKKHPRKPVAVNKMSPTKQPAESKAKFPAQRTMIQNRIAAKENSSAGSAASKSKGEPVPTAKKGKGGKHSDAQNQAGQSGKGGKAPPSSSPNQLGIKDRVQDLSERYWVTWGQVFNKDNPEIDFDHKNRPDGSTYWHLRKFADGVGVHEFHDNTDWNGTATTVIQHPVASTDGVKTDAVNWKNGKVKEWLETHWDGSKKLLREGQPPINYDSNGRRVPNPPKGDRTPKTPPKDLVPGRKIIDTRNPGHYLDGSPVDPTKGSKPAQNSFGSPGKRVGRDGVKPPDGSVGGGKGQDQLTDKFGNPFRNFRDHPMNTGADKWDDDSSDSDDPGDRSGTDSNHGGNDGNDTPPETNPSEDRETSTGDSETAGSEWGDDEPSPEGDGSEEPDDGDDASGDEQGGEGDEALPEGGGDDGSSPDGTGAGDGNPPGGLDFGDTDWYTNESIDKSEGFEPVPDGNDEGDDAGTGDTETDEADTDEGEIDEGDTDGDDESGEEDDPPDNSEDVGFTPADPDQQVIHRGPITSEQMAGLRGYGRGTNDSTPNPDDEDASHTTISISTGGPMSPMPRGKSLIVNPAGDARGLRPAIDKTTLQNPNQNEIYPSPDAPDQHQSGNSSGPPSDVSPSQGAGEHGPMQTVRDGKSGSSNGATNPAIRGARGPATGSVLDRILKARRARRLVGG